MPVSAAGEAKPGRNVTYRALSRGLLKARQLGSQLLDGLVLLDQVEHELFNLEQQFRLHVTEADTGCFHFAGLGDFRQVMIGVNKRSTASRARSIAGISVSIVVLELGTIWPMR
ncbi:MAG: hypothetical protein H0X11_05150 [Betaproteobacteria bacterium]|nr:hypothetical protein [Betaproteobacteria bacterium]